MSNALRGRRSSRSRVSCSVRSLIGIQTCMLTSPSIVFVHGLCGHSTKTWTKDDICWPKELLSREESLSHARILTYGYDANIVDTTGRASLNSLFQHSMNLLLDLSRERKQDAVSWGYS